MPIEVLISGSHVNVMKGHTSMRSTLTLLALLRVPAFGGTARGTARRP